MLLHISSINSILTCPARLEHMLKGTERRPMSGDMFAGSAYHRALAANFVQKVNSKRDLSHIDVCDVLSDAFDHQLVETSNDELEEVEVLWGDQTKGNLKDIAVNITTRYMLQLAPSVQPLSAERRLIKVVEDNPHIEGVSGRIDLEPEGTTKIIDHKLVGGSSAYRRGGYHNQDIGYEWISGLVGDFDHHLGVKLKTPLVEVSRSSYTQQDVEWFENKVLGPILKMAEVGVFPASGEGWHCSSQFCDFYQVCRGPLNPEVFGWEGD